MRGVLPASKADLQKSDVKLLDLIAGLSNAIATDEAELAQQDKRIAYLESQIDLNKVTFLRTPVRKIHRLGSLSRTMAAFFAMHPCAYSQTPESLDGISRVLREPQEPAQQEPAVLRAHQLLASDNR